MYLLLTEHIDIYYIKIENSDKNKLINEVRNYLKILIAKRIIDIKINEQL